MAHPHLSPHGVRFALHSAHEVTRVAVAGTFNHWDAQATPLRQVSATRWETTLPVAPGRHLYKYVLDDREWIVDPANPWVSEDGQNNSCFTLSEAGELFIRHGQVSAATPSTLYLHHTATPSPPWLQDAVICQLAAQAYGGLRGVIAELPALRALGITTIWLMPVQPRGIRERSGSLGDPYATRDFLALDPALGTEADLHALVQSAHRHGLRILLDWTLNRSSIDNPLTAAHPAWFQHDPAGNVTYAVPGRTAFAGFDCAHPGARRYIIDALQTWVLRYGFDGLRFDDSDLTPLAFLREIRAALTAVRPEIVLLSQSYDELHHLGACDVTYDGGVRETILQIAHGKTTADALQRYWEASTYSFPRGALRMRWLEEKEQDRAFRVFGPELHLAAATILLTLDGVPHLLMGQEWNEPRWHGWEALFEPFTLDRSAFAAATHAHYTALLTLRTQHAALRRGTVHFAWSGDPHVVRYWRMDAAEKICVTVNLAATPRHVAPLNEPTERLYSHGDGAETGVLSAYGGIVERVESAS